MSDDGTARSAQKIDVRGLATTYRRAGEGEPFLYLHGSGLTRRWLPLYDELALRFDTIVPEHPGFGDTPRPRWYNDVVDIALHYADLLDALGVDSVHIAAHSFGANVGGTFAALFPERVRSLAILAPGPIRFDENADVFPELPEGFDFDELLLNGHQDAYPEYRHADDEGDFLASSEGDSNEHPERWTGAPPASLYRRLSRYQGPASVLIPDEDRLFPDECAQGWAAALGGAPLVRVPGVEHPTGHLMIVQEPVQIAALLPPT